MSYGLLLIRVVIGGTMSAHGAQKLFGSFGGPGRDGTAGFFAGIGLEPARELALLAGLAELCGGILVALGLLTPFAALAVAVGLAAIGPGRFSLDRAAGWDDNLSGLWWGVGVLGASVILGLATVELGRLRGRRRWRTLAA